ncbi:MAG TPA: hypothetical protein VLE95_03480 [Chlamydiales bacterium]|nr:hypothetical protein [Chlamydiales bacterium]
MNSIHYLDRIYPDQPESWSVDHVKIARHSPKSDGASTIRKHWEDAPVMHQRPQLEPPRVYMLDLLEMHGQVEKVMAKEAAFFKKQTDIDLAQIAQLEKEKEEAFRKHVAESASKDNWSVLGSVAQYLAAGTSIALGLTLTSGWGTLLLASGLLGLGNKVVNDTIGWQSIASWFTKSIEMQKKLAQQIETGFLYLELGTGLCGGIGASANGIFSAAASNVTRFEAAKKALNITQISSTGVTFTTQMGKTFVEKRMNDLSAKMKTLDTLAELIRMEMGEQVTRVQNLIEMSEAFVQELHKAIIASEIQDL